MEKGYSEDVYRENNAPKWEITAASKKGMTAKKTKAKRCATADKKTD